MNELHFGSGSGSGSVGSGPKILVSTHSGSGLFSAHLLFNSTSSFWLQNQLIFGSMRGENVLMGFLRNSFFFLVFSLVFFCFVLYLRHESYRPVVLHMSMSPLHVLCREEPQTLFTPQIFFFKSTNHSSNQTRDAEAFELSLPKCSHYVSYPRSRKRFPYL